MMRYNSWSPQSTAENCGTGKYTEKKASKATTHRERKKKTRKTMAMLAMMMMKMAMQSQHFILTIACARVLHCLSFAAMAAALSRTELTRLSTKQPTSLPACLPAWLPTSDDYHYHFCTIRCSFIIFIFLRCSI